MNTDTLTFNISLLFLENYYIIYNPGGALYYTLYYTHLLSSYYFGSREHLCFTVSKQTITSQQKENNMERGISPK